MAPTSDTLVGTAVDPPEYKDHLRGTTQFTGDLIPKGCLHAAFVRSPHAAARIRRISKDAALGCSGVRAIVTGAEIAERGLRPRTDRAQVHPRFASHFGWNPTPVTVPAMAISRVTYVGEPVAIVVATSRYYAEDARDRIEIEYEAQPAVVDPLEALRPEAPLVHEGASNNVAATLGYEKGGFPDETEVGKLVAVQETYRVGRQSASPLEGRGVLAMVENGRVEVWSSTQAPRNLARAIEEATGWSASQIRVRAPAVGGAFGQKTTAYGEELTVAFLANELQAPVCWIDDRYENLVSATHGRDQLHRARLVVDRDGRIIAWEDDFVVDFGAFCWIRQGVLGNTAIHLLGPYRIPAVRIQGTGVFTNKTPTAQYRGAGRPEATFALERSLDAAARRLGISGARIRELNLLGPSDLPYSPGLPYRDGVDITFDGHDYQAVARAARGLVPEAEIRSLKKSLPASQRVGVGLAAYIEATGRGPEGDSVQATVTGSGRLVIRTGGGPSGQTHRTTLAQIAASVARVSFESVDVVTGDAEGLPVAPPTAASRTAVLTGSATHTAVRQLVAGAKRLVREAFGPGEPEHVDGGFRLRNAEAGTAAGLRVGQPPVDAPGESDNVVTWEQIGQWARDHPESPSAKALDVVGEFAPGAATWTMGVHVAVVSVSTETGEVRVERYAAAHEGGPAINPKIVEGQLCGGAVQGIGAALFEEITHDQDGQPTATTFMDYRVPTAADVPGIRLAHLEFPSRLNALGLRGIGESGIIAGNAAIASAVEDALKDYGLSIDRVPITPSYLLARMQEQS